MLFEAWKPYIYFNQGIFLPKVILLKEQKERGQGASPPNSHWASENLSVFVNK